MSLLSSEDAGAVYDLPVTSFLYREMGSGSSPVEMFGETEQESSEFVAAQQISDLVSRARAEAIAETEARLRQAYDAAVQAEARAVRVALDRFAGERRDYFSRVESEVVQLSLAIAAKILHRQAQVDPMLVTALVRVAVDKLQDGSSVSVRVSPLRAGKWRDALAGDAKGATIQIVEDADLAVEDCILETGVGSANFSIDAQLKEVEQGFFDLLAQRPAIK
jgi:flagellar assembly protein FliH